MAFRHARPTSLHFVSERVRGNRSRSGAQFQLAASLNGCQSGTGIFVQSGSGELSRVEIDHSTVHDFQKNGITADEKGTIAIIHRNVVTGVGLNHGRGAEWRANRFRRRRCDSRKRCDQQYLGSVYRRGCLHQRRHHILVTQSDGVEIAGNTAESAR